MRPVLWPVHLPRLHRRAKNYVTMRRQIFGIANGIFPEPALPKAFFTRRQDSSGYPVRHIDTAREQALEHSPAQRKTHIPRRQRPQPVNSIPQNHNFVDLERVRMAHPAHGEAQHIDVTQKQIAPPT